MHHGRRGNALYVDDFALCNLLEFDAYCVKRREVAFARAAASASARRQRQSVRKAATAAAKSLRDARLVARAASVAALALAAKVEKLARASHIASGAPRSPAAHMALQQERRMRKKAKRAAAAFLMQARRVAVVFVGRVIEAGVGRVVSRVVSGGDVQGKLKLESSAVLSSGLLRRRSSPKSKTMPRRKRSARKSGPSFLTCTTQLCFLLTYLYSSIEWARLASA